MNAAPSRNSPLARWLAAASLIAALGASLPAHAAGFDPSAWDRFLKANVSEEGWVDYHAIRAKHLGELKAFLRSLEEIKVLELSTRADRKAFWINAYNALTIRKLLDAGLPAEVPHASFFGRNIFTERTYRVAGKARSLDDIEHGILRKTFRDQRVHAALVCGASSCPRLRPEAYVGSKLDQQLVEEARRWIREGRTKKGERKNRLDRKRKVYWASKIFDWFDEDFGDSEAGILKFIRQYASEEDRKFLEENRVTLRFLDYDWRLNSR